MSVEAMKAIQMVYANTTKHDWPDDIWDAICKAIEAAVEEQHKPSQSDIKQEPVAEVEEDGVMRFKPTGRKYKVGDMLYLHPQPERNVATPRELVNATAWRGLTEQEQGAIMEDLNAHGTNLYHFAKAIEAKLKEKNT
jgi:hypothetical protein